MAQNEVQVKVTSEISNAKSYENDMKRIAKQREEELTLLFKAGKINEEQLASLKEKVNLKTFNSELSQIKKINALKEEIYRKEENARLDTIKKVEAEEKRLAAEKLQLAKQEAIEREKAAKEETRIARQAAIEREKAAKEETRIARQAAIEREKAAKTSFSARNVAGSLGKGVLNAIPGAAMFGNPLTASLAIGGGLATAGVGAVKSGFSNYASYQQAENKAKALAGSSFDANALDKRTSEIAAKTQFNKTDVAGAVNTLIQNGKTYQEALDMVETVAMTAIAHGKSVEESAGVIVSAQNQFKLSTDESTRIADVFTKATTVTALDFKQIEDGMKNAGPAMSAFGYSLEETTAMLGTLSNLGIQGSEGGTAIKSLINMMMGSQGQSTLSAYGVSSVDESGALRSLPDILSDFKKALDNSGKTEAEKIGEWKKISGEYVGQAQALAEQNENIKNLTQTLESSDGANIALADSMAQGLSGLVNSVKSIWENISTKIGEFLSPAFSGALEGIKLGLDTMFSAFQPFADIIKKWFGVMGPGIQQAAKVLTEIVGGTILATIITIGTIVSTIAGVVGWINKAFEGLTDAILKLVNASEKTVDIVKHPLKNIGNGIKAGFELTAKGVNKCGEWLGFIEKEEVKQNQTTSEVKEAVANIPTQQLDTIVTNEQSEPVPTQESEVEQKWGKKEWAEEVNMLAREGKITSDDRKTLGEFYSNDKLVDKTKDAIDILSRAKENGWAPEEKNRLINNLKNGTPIGEVNRQANLLDRGYAVDKREQENAKAAAEKASEDAQNEKEKQKQEDEAQRKKELDNAKKVAKEAKESYEKAMKDAGVTEEGLDQWSKGQFEVASKFSGTTASMSSYAQFDWEATGVDEKQLEELKSLNKNGKKLVSLLERSNDAQEKVENLEII